jgi:chemotaxis protein methyltransferase CheR
MADNITREQYEKFCLFLEDHSGIVLGPSKQYLVVSRLTPLISEFNMSSLSELLEKTQNTFQRQLRMRVIDAMTTNETLWFRDNYPYNMLKNKLLPEFANEKPHGTIRIWSAASSSGQEPYSIAMTCFETTIPRFKTPMGVQIIGTDISPTMLSHCKSGVYDYIALNRGLSPERKRHFFTKIDDQNMVINDQIKRLVTFKHLNLLESYAGMGKFDIIFCRNVLIYFSPQVKSKIINQMADCLNPRGYLFMGASEAMTGLCDRFEMIRCNPGIAYRLL